VFPNLTNVLVVFLRNVGSASSISQWRLHGPEIIFFFIFVVIPLFISLLSGGSLADQPVEITPSSVNECGHTASVSKLTGS
jgi:hypothetical protein